MEPMPSARKPLQLSGVLVKHRAISNDNYKPPRFPARRAGGQKRNGRTEVRPSDGS